MLDYSASSSFPLHCPTSLWAVLLLFCPQRPSQWSFDPTDVYRTQCRIHRLFSVLSSTARDAAILLPFISYFKYVGRSGSLSSKISFCTSSPLSLICSPLPKFHNPNSKFHNRNSEFHNRNSEFHNNNSEFHNRNSKFHNRKSKFHNRNSKFHNRNSKFHNHNSNSFPPPCTLFDSPCLVK